MTSGENSLNRSTTVRSRRMQRRAGQPSQRRSKNQRGRNVPAMVARNPQMEQHLNKGRKEARRRYPLKLASEGAELHLPALPVLRFGWRAISSLLLASLLLALYAVLTAPMFTINRVELAGAERINAQDINTALGVAGSPIFAVQPAQMASLLSEAFPELEALSVRVAFPARVVVQVDERQPTIAWEQSGLTVWVDAAGIAFIPEGEVENLVTVQAVEPPPPLVGEGYARHQLIRPEMVSAILTLSEHAPEGVSLLFDPELGFGWTDPGGWLAYFGAEPLNIEQRLAVYQSIVAELNGRGLTPTIISVAHLHGPYYRMDY